MALVKDRDDDGDARIGHGRRASRWDATAATGPQHADEDPHGEDELGEQQREGREAWKWGRVLSA
jgi:hypothetical protein